MGTIAQVTVEALVVCRNSVQFTLTSEPDTIVGKVMQVPCRDIRYDYQNMWAVPIKDSGIFTGCNFVLKANNNVAQPTFDSFTVFRIEDKLTNDFWFVYGTTDDLTTSCNTCCGDDAIAMPHVDNVVIERIAPTETIDLLNDSDDPYMVFGLPSLGAGQTYFPYGSLNNVALANANAAGYANTTTLLSFLNSNWTGFVWTVTADHLTLIATGGTTGDILGVNVIPIIPS